jgi:hypothetical protein
MRDLEAAGLYRRDHQVDPLVWTWLPYWPDNPVRAEREVLRAMRRLGVGPDPLDPPGAPEDELAPEAPSHGIAWT